MVVLICLKSCNPDQLFLTLAVPLELSGWPKITKAGGLGPAIRTIKSNSLEVKPKALCF